jgi:hypothetical protein
MLHQQAAADNAVEGVDCVMGRNVGNQRHQQATESCLQGIGKSARIASIVVANL